MASGINEHISSEERTKWNKTGTDLNAHIADKTLHIPSPPSSGNYYLGSDLQWHKVPAASITLS